MQTQISLNLLVRIRGHHLLKINTKFLDLPAKDWSSNPQFQTAKEAVASFSVVNDGAERGVKSTYNFLDVAR